MAKDKRYETVKFLIEAGQITTLSGIFDVVPKTVVAKDFGTNYQRFVRLINNPELFRLKEIYTLARMFGIDEMKMFTLINNQYKGKKKR